MDPHNPATVTIGIQFRTLAAASALLLAACSSVPPRTASRDALTPQEHVQLGNSYEAQGLRAQAVGQYEAAASADPAFAEPWLALGDIAFTDGRFKEAEADFRKAVHDAPHSPDAENNLSMAILARGGDLSEADGLAQDALLQQGPLQPYILDTLARIYLKERRYADAAAAVGRAEAAAGPADVLVRAQLQTTRDAVAAAAAAP